MFMEFSAPEESTLFDNYWNELKEIVEITGADHKFWQQLMLSCPETHQIAEFAAEKTLNAGTTWTIESGKLLVKRMYVEHKQRSMVVGFTRGVDNF